MCCTPKGSSLNLDLMISSNYVVTMIMHVVHLVLCTYGIVCMILHVVMCACGVAYMLYIWCCVQVVSCTCGVM